MTYLWTMEGWLYLAVIIDLFSRKVVGWAMSRRMKATLATEALSMAYWRRKPEKGLSRLTVAIIHRIFSARHR